MKQFTLVGVNGNAFSVMGYVTSAMREVGFDKSDIDAYSKRAIRGDYNLLLIESMDMIDKCNEKLGLQE